MQVFVYLCEPNMFQVISFLIAASILSVFIFFLFHSSFLLFHFHFVLFFVFSIYSSVLMLIFSYLPLLLQFPFVFHYIWYLIIVVDLLFISVMLLPLFHKDSNLGFHLKFDNVLPDLVRAYFLFEKHFVSLNFKVNLNSAKLPFSDYWSYLWWYCQQLQNYFQFLFPYLRNLQLFKFWKIT